MNRKSFIADSLMALAISMLPKSLLPVSWGFQSEIGGGDSPCEILERLEMKPVIFRLESGEWHLIGVEKDFELRNSL